MSFDIEDLDWRWTFDLYIDVKNLGVGGWCTLDFSISSGPF